VSLFSVLGLLLDHSNQSSLKACSGNHLQASRIAAWRVSSIIELSIMLLQSFTCSETLASCLQMQGQAYALGADQQAVMSLAASYGAGVNGADGSVLLDPQATNMGAHKLFQWYAWS
jgi:hypothetical protein